VYNKKSKKLTKKSKSVIVDLSNDGPFSVVSLSNYLSTYLKTKAKVKWKVLNKEGQLDDRWITQELPYWQEIWLKRSINIKYDRKQRAFFVTYIK